MISKGCVGDGTDGASKERKQMKIESGSLNLSMLSILFPN
jgi:hypothetical protein